MQNSFSFTKHDILFYSFAYVFSRYLISLLQMVNLNSYFSYRWIVTTSGMFSQTSSEKKIISYYEPLKQFLYAFAIVHIMR